MDEGPTDSGEEDGSAVGVDGGVAGWVGGGTVGVG